MRETDKWIHRGLIALNFFILYGLIVMHCNKEYSGTFLLLSAPENRKCSSSALAKCLANARKMSSVECKPASGSLAKYTFTQSCLYHNIYFINGNPTLFFAPGHDVPSPASVETMKNRDDFDSHFRPTIITGKSPLDLCSHCVVTHDDLTVLSHVWLGNIGHALLDSLYAIFVGLIEYGNRHLKPFRILNVRTFRDNPFVTDVINRSAPLGMVYAEDTFLQNPVHHFRELLVPNFARCMSCTDDGGDPIYYGMNMGYELDAFRLLRTHLHRQFDVPFVLAPSIYHISAIAVDNKRFTDGERDTIKRALQSVAPDIQGRLINWASMSFRDQLILLAQTQIYVSSVGTAIINQPFMPDGSVLINLGSCHQFSYQAGIIPSLLFPSSYTAPMAHYMEQSIVASTPYHKALYYPLDEICKGLKTRRIVDLLESAAHIVKSKFAIPVPRGSNLAVTGRIVQELMRMDPDFRERLSNPVAYKECSTGTYFWPEIVLNPNGPWSSSAWWTPCKLNQTAVLALEFLKEMF